MVMMIGVPKTVGVVSRGEKFRRDDYFAFDGIGELELSSEFGFDETTGYGARKFVRLLLVVVMVVYVVVVGTREEKLFCHVQLRTKGGIFKLFGELERKRRAFLWVCASKRERTRSVFFKSLLLVRLDDFTGLYSSSALLFSKIDGRRRVRSRLFPFRRQDFFRCFLRIRWRSILCDTTRRVREARSNAFRAVSVRVNR